MRPLPGMSVAPLLSLTRTLVIGFRTSLIQDDRIYRSQLHSVSSAKTLFLSAFTGSRWMSLLGAATQPGGGGDARLAAAQLG